MPPSKSRPARAPRTPRTPTTPPADGTYRGRRRLPKLPGRRYFRVVATAFACATAVALAAGMIVPGRHARAAGLSDVALDRLGAANEEKRMDLLGGGVELNVDPDAPDLWVLPLKAKYLITTRYEYRDAQPGIRAGWHYGVDLAEPFGTPIYATHAGTILVAGWLGDYGNCTMIDNGNGVITVYGHASQLFTTPGQRVQAGQQIAAVGSTGESSGNHLHYEVRLVTNPATGAYQETDPIPFMLARGVDLEHQTEEASGQVIG